MKTAPEIRAEWLAQLLSTASVDRPHAEASLRDLYLAADLPPPSHFFWFDSPYSALWAMGLLMAAHDPLWQRILDAMGRYKRERELIERLRITMCQDAALTDWPSLVVAAGQPMAMQLAYRAHQAGESLKMIQHSLTLARLELYPNVNDSLAKFDETDDLSRAEYHLRGAIGGQNGWSTINTLMSASLSSHYSLSTIAMDEAALGARPAPPLLTAAWAAARAVGLWWWPLTGSVVLSDRPIEVHVNEKFMLHQGDGPALVYRDDLRIWAWNGRAMREEWIMRPAGIPPRELKQFDAAFRAYAAERMKTAPPVVKVKLSSILKKALPASPDERVAMLRRYNRGTLPLFDRYAAGEYEKVWDELIALGPAARADPNAADALAVAYETMRRVDLNVREVTARLRALGYRFAYDADAHDPPGPSIHRQITRLEKKTGAIPLSLRAFYEVVGTVNWMGEHAGLAPRESSVAPDPLVVYPIEAALADGDESFEDGEGSIVVAPDDLHKSNTSGGEPYEIAIPGSGADGKLLNERHDLYFVAYLRMVFRFGGFPGYEGIDVAVPAELAALRANLHPF